MATDSNRAAEVKAFDETGAGVKGLVDSGITKLPNLFIHPRTAIHEYPVAVALPSGPAIPVIDLAEAHVQRGRVVGRVCEAAETYGFFQVVNHGIPVGVLEAMICGARGFFEQDLEEKKKFYTRDYSKKFVYLSNVDLYASTAASWRDTITCVVKPTPNPEELPLVCRDILLDYSKQVMKLAVLLFELLSEALGLPLDYLKDMGCCEGQAILCHYSPPCPQPDKTIYTTRHTDNTFITVLLQDHIGGLQVLHDRQWFDVPPVSGALVVNIGDFLQLVANDRFKSVEHRVVASKGGPRVSVASFFNGTRLQPNPRMYGPIKELLSEENPAKYRETTLRDFLLAALDRSIYGTSGLVHLKLRDI